MRNQKIKISMAMATKQLQELKTRLDAVTRDMPSPGERFTALQELIKQVTLQKKMNHDSEEALKGLLTRYEQCGDLAPQESYALKYLKGICLLIRTHKKAFTLDNYKSIFQTSCENWEKFRPWAILLEGLRGFGSNINVNKFLLEKAYSLFDKPEKSPYQKYALWKLAYNLHHREPDKLLETIINEVAIKQGIFSSTFKKQCQQFKDASYVSILNDLLLDENLRGLDIKALADLLDAYLQQSEPTYSAPLAEALEHQWNLELNKQEEDTTYQLNYSLRHQLDLYIINLCPNAARLNALLEKLATQLRELKPGRLQLEQLKAAVASKADTLTHKDSVISIINILLQESSATQDAEQSLKDLLEASDVERVDKGLHAITLARQAIMLDPDCKKFWQAIAKSAMEKKPKDSYGLLFRSFPELQVMLADFEDDPEKKEAYFGYARTQYIRLLQHAEKMLCEESTVLVEADAGVVEKKPDTSVQPMEAGDDDRTDDPSTEEDTDGLLYREDIHKLVADLAYSGKVFTKNLCWSRQLYETAVRLNVQSAMPMLARMYFYAEGGPLEYEQALECIENSPMDSPERATPWWQELLADHYYLQYLRATDSRSDPGSRLIDCISVLRKLANERAVNYLWMLMQYEMSGQASTALIELFQQKVPFPAEIMDNRSDEALSIYLCRKAEQLGTLESLSEDNSLRQQYLAHKAGFEEKKHAILENQKEVLEGHIKPLLDNATLFSDISALQTQLETGRNALLEENKTTPLAKLLHALLELTKGNTVPIRRFDYLQDFTSPELSQEALREFLRASLSQYYASTLVENPEEKLLTIVCYEAIHADEASIEYTMMRAVLDKNYPDYAGKSVVELQKILTGLESEKGAYFDEAPSDDSDADDEVNYHGTSHFLTADVARRRDLYAGIETILQKQLAKLDTSSRLGVPEFEKFRKKFHNAFSPAVRYGRTQQPFRVGISAKGLPSAVHDDIAILNDYNAHGKLAEGLALVRTPFVLAQTRGIHSFIDHWGATNRRKMRRRIFEAEHKAHGKPLFSHAVYKRAGIHDYSDLSEITYLRLEKIALHLYQQFMALSQEPIPSDAPWVTARKYPCDTFTLQMQQLYSNDYAKFHNEYLPWLEEKKHIHTGKANPCVSTGDIEADHAAQYAFGQKVYSGHEHRRLRPRYQQDGRPLRPYSGYVVLLLCPLEDYTRGDTHHIPSLVRAAKLMVQQEVMPERENTFMVKLDSCRMVFMVSAKFPSFHHADYPESYKHKYGISRGLYFLIKKIIAESKPHDTKRRLLDDFLGTYLSAYNQLYLMRYAFEQTTDKYQEGSMKHPILLYRDPVGNFSLRSTLRINPTPHGHEEWAQLQRLATSQRRAGSKRKAEHANIADESTDPRSSVPRHTALAFKSVSDAGRFAAPLAAPARE